MQVKFISKPSIQLIGITAPYLTRNLNYRKKLASSIMGYFAAKQCYNPDYKITNEEIEKCNTVSSAKKFLLPILESGHLGILEHCSVSFHISDISRACSHQLVRHRLASYTQQSQRYSIQNNKYVLPESIEKSNLKQEYEEMLEQISNLYEKLVSNNIPKEDARFILPNAATTQLVMSCNYRELIHFIELRMCNRAQWEIRHIANIIFEIMHLIDPVVFGIDAYCKGPKCMRLNYCDEAKGCGFKKKLKITEDK